ncbi:hypothetical protein A2331_06525 [Candidatus Falkowbacteria bacterium RIFOXYB2_FULL_34_18]|uniref:Uncharacterized protein n=1 Tax=Candidatus Falkowbacteria bacterium RIFOXYD2_FULL_34_120 TaxID=1798007 RepID=A0A1F5TRG9_9BACT|nr:MAG: hypothetical protein A2331_06525 [Candidatus Falkowbacteria bacterium RIFOXYB2_FULL_34_18]OGF36637.1 MAG: hypothetical protein A2466_03445 [Candidatus Falkowbacteria bacterium RIFOXYC2_FULL_34_220]OGF39290.1 MAG: hypothetical protein A2515_01910 [Candidatus Falkowbacteria bacterium RIFOXYD12_FULL_34_57]OGF41428.1 MAG: hypothetical protein A2531_00075 [Candidatus Falkowbacteria bacterium RIFOXYD2_FULL_34_120]
MINIDVFCTEQKIKIIKKELAQAGFTMIDVVDNTVLIKKYKLTREGFYWKIEGKIAKKILKKYKDPNDSISDQGGYLSVTSQAGLKEVFKVLKLI